MRDPSKSLIRVPFSDLDQKKRENEVLFSIWCFLEKRGPVFAQIGAIISLVEARTIPVNQNGSGFAPFSARFRCFSMSLEGLDPDRFG